jgi:hypothetical protein
MLEFSEAAVSKCAWFKSPEMGGKRLFCAVFLVAACAQASLAHADRVVLVSGAVLEGRAKREGGKVVVTTDSGDVALPADMVKSVEASDSGVQEFEAKRARIAQGDVPGLLALANYCRDHDMPAHEQEALRRVLEAAPDHAEARARLGYVKTQAGWMTQDEQMQARGLVKYEGQWMTREQMRDMEGMMLESAAAEIADERERAHALQAEFDAEQEQNAARASMQAQPWYPAYGYGYGPFAYRTTYRSRAYPADYAHARGFGAPAVVRPAPAAPPPRPAPASPPPQPMRMQDAAHQYTHGAHRESSRR